MKIFNLAFVSALAMSSAGCVSFSGYPVDPQPSNALDELRLNYFANKVVDCYNAAPATPVASGHPAAASTASAADACGYRLDAGKRAIRDDIVLNRIHVYDMEFSLFVRELSGGNNIVSLGSDLTAFALNGLGATTGDAATKAALAAASAGVLSANGAVDKDLFYQKTIPALIAQMEADRTKVEVTIINGLKQGDDDYPLQRATLDLDALSRAGSINGAVANITQKATDDKKVAEKDLAAPYRDTKKCETDDCNAIRRWLLNADGTPNDTNLTKLVQWCNDHVPQDYASNLPAAQAVVNTPGEVFDLLRAQVIKDLSIKSS